jgi:hypothetical protein
MGFSKEFEEQMAAIRNLVDATVEQRVDAKSAATLTVQVKMLGLLNEKGLLSNEDIESFIRDIELNAVTISKVAPETGKELADMALNLRNALLPQEGKPN